MCRQSGHVEAIKLCFRFGTCDGVSELKRLTFHVIRVKLAVNFTLEKCIQTQSSLHTDHQRDDDGRWCWQG